MWPYLLQLMDLLLLGVKGHQGSLMLYLQPLLPLDSLVHMLGTDGQRMLFKDDDFFFNKKRITQPQSISNEGVT